MAISVGLNTALSALLAQQRSMDAVAHNIANVNTPGYSRQRVQLEPVPPASSGMGVGGGVNVVGIERVRDLFVDFQLRSESHAAGEFRARADSLQLVELAFGEISDSGLAGVLDGFWNSWRELANAPEQSAARSAVVQAGESFVHAANRLHRSFTSIRDDANTRIATTVREVNDLAREIATLNQQIASVRAKGDPASDLTDRRDLALDRLAQLADVQIVAMDGGRVDVFLGGRALVTGTRASALEVEPDPGNEQYFAIRWADGGQEASIKSGRLGGLLHQRDVDIPARLADLDTLVSQIVDDVNAAHEAGFGLDGVTTGVAFFTGTGAADIAVNADVRANLGLIAAATNPGAPGDGSNAQAIADLQRATNLNGGNETYGAFYNSMVTELGVSLRDVQNQSRAQELTLQYLEQLRQSVSGVNLDEEMVSLIQYQRGYESAARLIRVIDEMLDTLINRT